MFAIRALDQDAVPDIWQVLADPTRRGLIDLLSIKPCTTSELCAVFPLSRFAVMKHLGLLCDAGLVASRKVGRVRTNILNPAPLVALHDRWLSPRAVAWTAGIAHLAKSLEQKENPMVETAQIAHVALDWTINASPAAVWNALFDQPETWWPAEHRAVGGDARMHFSAKLGAELREELADGGGVSWYSVYAMDPGRTVDLRGDLAARYGGPATSLLHLAVSDGQVPGTTMLKLTDSLMGQVSAATASTVADGWQQIIGDGLVASLNR